MTKNKKRLIVAHARGVKIRFVTEITTDNLPYCKQMMEELIRSL
jgi:hypothetical protein